MNPVRKSFLLYLLMAGLVGINLAVVSEFPFSTYIIYIIIILVVLRINEGIFWGNKFKHGLKLGAVLISTVFMLELIAGWVVVTGFVIDGNLLLFSLFFHALVAFSEEISFRGYILKNLIGERGLKYGIIVNSLMFSALHVPSFGFYKIDIQNGIVAFIVIVLTSIIISIVYIEYGLLSATGFHLAWNFLQYNVFTLSKMHPGILEIESAAGLDLLTGGIYGPEAGIAGLLVVLTALVVILIRAPKYAHQLLPECQILRK
ncbi:MAG: lysostaphin resistance A-like protein [Candidatus Methanoperedens sp.]|nr:CPBP family intramembrane glutamic endopeptidase [Candidatus Methanoperedens sp.]